MHPEATTLLSKLAAIPNTASLELSTRDISQNYIILFSPRSGSTWLTELLSNNKNFGTPCEWFNPEFIPLNAKKLQCNSIFDYVSLTKSFNSDKSSGIFGAEITGFQLDLMNQLVCFYSHFPSSNTIYFRLRRKNIVAQGISLYHAVKSGLFHTSERKKHVGTQVEFDLDAISYWIEHILVQERIIDHFIAQMNIIVHELYYEDMMTAIPRKTINFFNRALLKREIENPVVMPIGNRKLLGPNFKHWEERYIQNFPLRLQEINRDRKIDSNTGNQGDMSQPI